MAQSKTEQLIWSDDKFKNDNIRKKLFTECVGWPLTRCLHMQYASDNLVMQDH